MRKSVAAVTAGSALLFAHVGLAADEHAIIGTYVWDFFRGPVTLRITSVTQGGVLEGSYQFQTVKYELAREPNAAQLGTKLSGNALEMKTPGGAIYNLTVSPNALVGQMTSSHGAQDVEFTRQ